MNYMWNVYFSFTFTFKYSDDITPNVFSVRVCVCVRFVKINKEDGIRNGEFVQHVRLFTFCDISGFVIICIITVILVQSHLFFSKKWLVNISWLH